MEKIELLEKLVDVQEMHIELMNDFANLQGSMKSLEEVKNRRVADLKIQIGHQDEKIAALEKQNAELKKQVEELQKLIPIELVGKEQENQ